MRRVFQIILRFLPLQSGLILNPNDLEFVHFAFFFFDRLLDDLEKLLDGFIALHPADQLLFLELFVLAEVHLDESLQIVLFHHVFATVDLEDRGQATREHELQLCDLDDEALVQVEHFEEKLDFGFDVGLAVQNHGREDFEGVDEPLVVGVPNGKGGLVHREDLLVLGQRNREVVADALKGAVVFFDLVQGF